jgi:glycosyltransferase involved in cell wall biosynthesis
MYRKKIAKKKRILAVFSEVNSSPQLLSIVSAAQDSGFDIDVIIFSSKENLLSNAIRHNGIFVKHIKPRGKTYSGVLFVAVAWKIFVRKPDILFASGLYADVVGLATSSLLRVKRRIFVRHHSNFHSKNANSFGVFIDRLCNFMATDIVAVSKIVQKILIIDENVPQEKVHLIHNGIDLALFKDNKKSRTTFPPSPSKSVFRIGMVSRMTTLKGIEYTARAFVRIYEEFPFTTFCVVGQFADSYQDVQRILRHLPTSSFTLLESTESVPKFLSGLDVFVHVPIGDEDESFGLVYVEALAMNLHCIFTLSGVLHELPNLENHVSLVNYMSSEDIYKALQQVLIGADGNKSQVPESWIDQFELGKMADTYVRLFATQGQI